MTIAWDEAAVVEAQNFDFVKVSHVVAGVYLWELANSVAFDWHLLNRQAARPAASGWTKAVYLASRYLGLIVVAGAYFQFDQTFETNCKASTLVCFIAAYLAVLACSTLIAIRNIAIWNRSRIMIGLSATFILAQAAALFYEASKFNARWVPVDAACRVLNTQTSQPYVTITLVTDFFLVGAMLLGLYRWRDARAGRFGLWTLLWNQGMVWLVLALCAEVPTAAFQWLNLNQPMNLIFLMPELATLVIGATRMYRGLWQFTTSYSPNAVPTFKQSGGRRATRFGNAIQMSRIRIEMKGAAIST